MSTATELRPGLVRLEDWRAVYRGGSVALDPIAQADVEAGAAALQAMIATSKTAAPAAPVDESPAMFELLRKGDAFLPAPLVRLFVALKLARLAQGVSGVRWTMVQTLAQCLDRGILPAVPAANAGDRLAASHIFAVLTGTGEALGDGGVRPAAKALRESGLEPFRLSAEEKAALLSGGDLSLAFALSGLFEAERVLQSALVVGALAFEGHGRADLSLESRVERLSRQPGRNESAAAMRALLGSRPLPHTAPKGPEEADAVPAGQDGCARFAARMGLCLDLLRSAGAMLERASNAATGERLVLWQTGEIASVVDDAAPISVCADLVAFSLGEIALLAEGQLSRSSAFQAAGPPPIDMAAGFVNEVRSRARPTGIEMETESGGPAMFAAGAARLLPMAGTTALVVAIAFLAARNGAATHPAVPPTGLLQPVRDLLSQAGLPSGKEGGIGPTDLAIAADLVRSGVLANAAGVPLPSVAPPRMRGKRRPDAARHA